MMRMTRHNPERAAATEAAYRHLEKHLFPVHDRLPVAFCHGHPHPINVIWGEDHIRAVIDREFLGYKQEIYDAALVIGYIGMEDPESLMEPMVLGFLDELKTGHFRQVIFFHPARVRPCPALCLAVGMTEKERR